MPAKGSCIPIRERLMRHVEIQPNGCWLWVGCVGKKGYAKFKNNGKTREAHIVAFEVFKGPIPDGLDLDHICHKPSECPGGVTCPHRRCVNPDHLEPVTPEENMRRGHPGCLIAARVHVINQMNRTHCKRGHKFTPDNLSKSVDKPHHRICLACTKERLRLAYINKKNMVAA